MCFSFTRHVFVWKDRQIIPISNSSPRCCAMHLGVCQWSSHNSTLPVIGCLAGYTVLEGITKFILKGATTATSKSSFASISMICMSLPQMFKQTLPPKKKKTVKIIYTPENYRMSPKKGDHLNSRGIHRLQASKNSGDIWPHPAVTATRLRSSHIDPW